MNGELVPAAVAAGGGSALLGGIAYYERRQRDAMRASRGRLVIRFPLGMDAASAQAALGALSGLPITSEIVLELIGDENGITHALHIPKRDLPAVRAALSGALRSVRFTESPGPVGSARRALRLFVPRMTYLRATELEAGSAGLLAGLAGLRPGERVVIRWTLQPGSAPRLTEPKAPSREWRRRARLWTQKTAGPGFSARGIVLADAATSARARILVEVVAGVYRSRRGAFGSLRSTVEFRGRNFTTMPGVSRWDGWLSASELLALVGWPIGDSIPASVELGAARELQARPGLPREGRRLLLARDALGERAVALSGEAARHGLAVIGPTGSGKSVALARGALDDIAAGYGGCVIDPKGGDLVQTIIDRIRPEDADRLVVLDPSASERPIGTKVLGVGDRDLAAELLAGVIRRSTPEWGIRTEQYLTLGLRTLAEVPGATLADMSRLFFDAGYRRAAVARLRDDVLVGQWRAFEMLSPAAQAEHLQAPMARVTSVLSRPSVRGVLANPAPRLDIGRVIERRGWLLASLSPGTLGETGASIVTTALLFLIWSAMEARVALPPEERHPIFITIDELASVAGMGFSVPLMFERLRGLGGGLSVGVQTLGRLPEATRSALLGNVASLVTFRGSAEESVRLSRELPGLDARDIQSLGRFEVAARLGTGLGSAVTVVTGRTEPLPPPTGQAGRIRARSAEVYGSSLPRRADHASEPIVGVSTDSLGRSRRDG